MQPAFIHFEVTLAVLSVSALGAHLWAAFIGGAPRRKKRRLALFTILFGVMPLWQAEIAVVFLPTLLLQGSAVLSRIWALSALGPDGSAQFLSDVARRSSLRLALGAAFAKGLHTAALGGVLVALSRGEHDWAYWIGLAVVSYAVGMTVTGFIDYIRLYRVVRHTAATDGTASGTG